MININCRSILFLIFTLGALSELAAQSVCPIIPQPVKSVRVKGSFTFDNSIKIVGEQQLASSIACFRQTLVDKCNLRFASNKNAKPIYLLLQNTISGDEAYELVVSSNKIEIRAGDKVGIANGLTSLAQLVLSYYNGKSAIIPNWSIKDQPRFAWRGVMLDESRHFFGEQKVKQILDWMAYYKLNKFHWHLTDEDGWRIPIDSYPKLTSVGGIGDRSDKNATGKFYNKQQIKAIVAYAAIRNIEVIPEIDMPGHATAANRAYPEYSGGGTKEHPEFTFNPGKEATYSYLTDILKDVKLIFNSDKVHLGADEVAFGAKAWESNEDVKALMAKHQLNNVLEVENYFVKRMADSINKLGAKVLAWDEALLANLDNKKTILFWWRHDKPQILDQALARGYSVVVCPRLPLYLDFVQDGSHKLGRKWAGKFNTLLNVYNYPGTETFVDNPLVKGLQANLWTETIYNAQRLDFMLFPRIAAVAEAGWTLPENKNNDIFLESVKNQLKLYSKQAIYYFDPFNERQPTHIENPHRKSNTDYLDPFMKETKLGRQNR
jgi:hexosaminidase